MKLSTGCVVFSEINTRIHFNGLSKKKEEIQDGEQVKRNGDYYTLIIFVLST